MKHQEADLCKYDKMDGRDKLEMMTPVNSEVSFCYTSIGVNFNWE
jgi:hypothetical protein